MSKFMVLLSLCICLSFPAQAESGRKHNKRPSISAKKKAVSRARIIFALQAKQKEQYRIALKYNLYIKDADELKELITHNLLALISDTGSYYLDEGENGIGYLDPDNKYMYHYARFWVKPFLDTELGAVHKETGDIFKIPSLVRTPEYQLKLHKDEKGAILGGGWRTSSHETGATVDISFEGVSDLGKKLLGGRLRRLEKKEHKIIVVEEVKKGHWHVMVLPNYIAKHKK